MINFGFGPFSVLAPLCYLVFGQRPRFPINLYFPTLRGETEKFHVNHYVADIQKCLEQALEIAQKQNKDEAL